MSKDLNEKPHFSVLFKDDCSRYRFVYCVRYKFEVFDKFKALQSLVLKEMGNRIEKLRSHWGGEYMSAEFIKYLVDGGIHHETTSPYTPEQNGNIKRENQTLVKSVKNMLYGKKLNIRLWGEAVQVATYLLNHGAWFKNQGLKDALQALVRIEAHG